MALMVIVCLLVLIWLIAMCAVPAKAQQSGTVVIPVHNFGRPMEPISQAFTNDPERIVLSKNFYSTQPRARQTRNGVVTAFNYSSLKTAPVDALTTLEPQTDSAAVVFMAGGKWWWSFYGLRATGEIQYVSSMGTPREVHPYSPGTVSIGEGTRNMEGTGTYFTRYLQAGDTLYVDSPSDTFIVRAVVSDIFLVVDSVGNLDTHIFDEWQASRVYAGADPFLYPSGEMVYSGSVKDKPQVLFNKDDTVFLRPLVMVDSFYVDAIAPLHYRDTSGSAELRRSYANAGTDTVVEEIQLISRRASWLRDQWLATSEGAPVSYFVRLGWWDSDNDQWGRFYTIRGNSDTSMYLASWYRDSLVTGVPVNVQLSRGDSMKTADVALSPWAYIYTSVGAFDVAVPDSATGSANLYGRGAVWRTIDPAPFLIDTAEFYNNLYFLHLTRDDISFPAYTAGFTVIKVYTIDRIVAENCTDIRSRNPLTQDQLPLGDTIIGYREEREILPGRCDNMHGIWTIRSTNPKKPVQAQFVNESFYPVRNARRNGDTLWIVTSAADLAMVADTSIRSTANWEIVKVGMPSWAGMTSWSNPPQLVAWGDTNSLSLLSSAGANDPWNWVANNDVVIGVNPSEPVVGVLGFDDQLLAFKHTSITGFDGSRYTDISQGHGLIAKDALVADNKQAFWADVDGIYTIARRDFSGYTIQKISAALDPVFNTWSAGYFGSSVVPFAVNPAKRNQMVLRKNKFDDHLYLWFAADSSATNNRCLTYSLARNEWDGLFTTGASAAMPFVWKDTTCLMYARNDTAMVMRTSLNWNDNGVGITSELKSGRFWVSGQSNWPMWSRLYRVRFAGRGSDLLFDTLRLVVSVNSGVNGTLTSTSADSVNIDMSNSVADGQFTWYPSKAMVGTYWDWRIYVDGGTTGTLFAPYELLFEFVPLVEER
jgi:hypothetical protein